MKNKIGKQIVATLISLLFVVGFLPIAVSADEYTEGGLKYNYNTETMTAEVTGYDSSGLPSDVIIPKEVTVNGKNYTVTSIGKNAFSVCDSLTSIEIPDSVISIGEDAFFYCENLKSIKIPDSVTSIGEDAFSVCRSLVSVELPKGINSIEGSTFSNCSSLINITIPYGVTSIGEYAFSNCSNLTSIDIPDSVTSIGTSAFAVCTSLSSIEIPDSVTSIGYWAFSGCSILASFTIPDSISFIDENALSYCPSLTNVYANEGLTFDSYLFDGNGQQINVWRYKIETDSEESKDGKTHVSIVSLEDKDGNKITGPLEIYDGAMGDKYVIDKTESSNISIKHTVNKVEYLAPTCTTDGNIEFWHCTVCDKYFKDEGLTEEIKEEDTIIKATGHKYGEPTWSWNEDYSKATVIFTCSNDETHKEVLEAKVTSVTVDPTIEKEGKTTYTATVTFEGKEYTATEEVTLDKLPPEEPVISHVHTYTSPVWSWSDDLNSVKVSFTCEDKDDTQVLEAKVTSTTTEATTDKEGKVVYTATVTFEGKEYTDSKEVALSKLPIITSGNNSSWNTTSKEGLSFTSDAEFKDFLKVLVDNKEIDSKYYTVKEGSTIVTLSNDFLKTLSVDKHTLSIVSTTGTATANFEVIKGETVITVPDTGIDATITYLLSLSAILSLGITVTIILKKKYSK